MRNDKQAYCIWKHSTKLEECSLIRNDNLSFYDIWSKVTWNKCHYILQISKEMLTNCFWNFAFRHAGNTFSLKEISLSRSETQIPWFSLEWIMVNSFFSTLHSLHFVAILEFKQSNGSTKKTTKNLAEVQLMPGWHVSQEQVIMRRCPMPTSREKTAKQKIHWEKREPK